MAAVALGTGGAGADTDTRILEDVQGVLGGNSGNRQVQDVGGLVGTVDPHSGER